MPARSKPRKRSLRIVVLNEERRTDWQIGRGIKRTPFESKLASWAGIHPAISLNQAISVLYHVWSPATRSILQALLAEETEHPGRNGLARAIRSVRRIWRDVWIDQPPSKGGRPALTRERLISVWVMFNAALGKALLRDPKMTKVRVKAEFVAFSKKGRNPLSSIAQLDKMLKAVERSMPKEQRLKTLRHFIPDAFHLLGRSRRPNAGTKPHPK